MNQANSDAKKVFLGALDRDSPDELTRYLDEQCGENVESRSRVEELLRAHGEVGNFLGGPPSKNPTADAPLAEGAGTVIGPYKLLQQIGEGGMGVVYMADQTEPVERRVALKIIKPGMDTQQVIARFEAERQALAMMDHPNIAKVLDAGTTESGRPYFVMELVKGVPITEYCDQQQLTPKDRLELFIPVCHAVQHAHQKGLIHRDLKPNNILIARYDDRAVPKVIDFGVAKATAQRLTEKTMFTQYGQIIGTLEYMSPEQAQLNQLDIDTRSDIYALGVLLYELLTGTTPFDRKRLQSAAFEEMMRIIREEDPPRPSTRLSTSATLPTVAANRHLEPQRLTALVRGDLDWIVMKALEKDRSRRYETANGLAEDIQHYLHDEPVRACPPSAVYRFRKFARRNKATLTTAVMVAAALLFGLMGTGWQAVRATRAEGEAKTERDIAKAERSEADEARQLAEQQKEQVTHLLTSSYVNRAQTLCEQGEIGRGMIWFAHALRMTPDDAHDLGHVIRANLAAWAPHLHSLKTMVQAPSEIVAVDLSPDGSRILTGSADGVLRLWDAATGGQIAESALRHEAWAEFAASAHVGCAVFSPDGSRILTASYEGTAHLWNATTLEPVGKPLQHAPVNEPVEPKYRVRIVAFSPDGLRIATASGHGGVGTVRLWDAATLEPVGGPFQAGSPLTARFCPDGLRVIVWKLDSASGVHQLWDVDRAKPIGPPVAPYSAVAAAIGPDGSMFAIAVRHGGIGLCRAGESDPVLQPIVSAGGIARTLLFNPDGSRLCGGDTRASILWDTATGMPVGPPMRQGSAARVVAFSRDGTHILAGGEQGSVWLWEVASDKSAGLVMEHEDRVVAAGFGPRGLRLLTNTDNSFQFRNAKTGEAIGTAFSQQGEVGKTPFSGRLLFSPDGSRVLIPGNPFQLRDVTTGQPIGPTPDASFGATFSPDGSRILGESYDFARLWDTATLEPIGTTLPHREPAGAVAFSPNGMRFITGSYDGTTTLWDATTLEPIGKSLRFQSGIQALAYGPDGALILAGFTSGAVRLWDSSTLAPIGLPVHHQNIVQSVAFSPDSSRFLTSSSDETSQLWDTSTQERVGPQFEHRGFRRPWGSFSGDGTEILVVGQEGKAQLWKAPPGPLDGSREQIALWTELVTGLTLNESDDVEPLDGLAWQERRRRVERLGGPPTSVPLLPAAPPPETTHSRVIALALAGHATAEHGQWEKAAAEFAKALGLSNDSPTLRSQIACWWGKLADDWLESAQHDESEKSCAPVVQFFKQSVEALPDGPAFQAVVARQSSRLIHILRKTGATEEARRHYCGALASILGEGSAGKSPQKLRDEAAKLLGISVREASELLINHCTKAIERDAVDWRAFATRGDLLQDLKQWERAIEDLSAAIRIKPDDLRSRFLRVSCYAMLREFENALADSDRLIELDPNNTWAYAQRASCLNELDYPERAITDCDRALQLDPRNYNAMLRRAEANANLERYESAYADVIEGIRLSPDTITYRWEVLVHVALSSQNPDLLAEPLDDLREHFGELEPGSPTAMRLAKLYALQARLLRQMGRLDDAVDAERQLVALYPSEWKHRLDAGTNLVNEGIGLVQVGHDEEADSRFAVASLLIEQVIDEIRDQPNLRYKLAICHQLLGRIHASTGRAQDALTAFNRALELQPRYAFAHARLADFLLTNTEVRDPAQALEHATQAVDIQPDAAHFQGSLGRARYRTGDYAAAVETLEKSIASAAPARAAGGSFRKASDCFFLAMAHWQLGHQQEARESYGRAIELAEKYAANEDLSRLRAEAAQLLGIVPEVKETVASAAESDTKSRDSGHHAPP
jgi:WD40 repeat protein/serine/threonine protein kinase/tetratricopeptide (TPR) repeat protein